MIKNIINNAFRKPLWAFVIIALGFLLGLIPPFFLGVGAYWDNYKLILLALVPVIYFGFHLLTKQKEAINIPVYGVDVSWLFFLTVCFFSFNWSTNGSLIWSSAFNWTTLILWMFLIRHLLNKEQKKEESLLMDVLLLTFLAIAFHVFVVLSAGQLILLERWNSHFGHTSNYTSAFLLGLSPFLLFYPNRSKWMWLLKIIGVVFIFIVIQKASAKGSLLAFIAVGLYFLWTLVPETLVKKILIAGTILSILFFTFFINSNLELLQQFGNTPLKEVGTSHRLYLLKSSISMFMEAPILGQGLGNWFVNAYTEDLNGIVGFNHPAYYIRLGTHNLFELILVELGLVGFLCFSIPFIIVIVKALLDSHKYDALQKAAVTTILVYLMTAMFYRDANLYEAHFSGLQLLIFVSLGLLFRQQKKYELPSKSVFRILTILGIASFLWFCYYYQTDKKYETVVKALNRLPNAELLDDYLPPSYFEDEQQSVENIEETTLLMESIYHPVFKTTHGFYGGGRGANRLITLHLAQLYQRQGQYDVAETYYQKSLLLAPNDELLLKSYARFLLRIKKNYSEAKNFALRAYNIQKNNFYCNILLGEIAIQEKDYEGASKYLEFVEKHPMDYGFKNLSFILLAELALVKGDIEVAKAYLEKVNSSYYTNQIIILQSRLN